MNEFEDKIVVVTGAGRGIGRAVACAFAAHGAIVAANDITPLNLDETLALIAAAGGRAKDYIFDVAKRMPVEAMFHEILDDWGRVDVLANCANVEPRAAIVDMDEWDWERALSVNLSGPFYAMQQAGRAMRAQGGAIVNFVRGVSGRAAFPGYAAFAGYAAYITSQHGLLGLTRAAADELRGEGIRVNAIFLGKNKTALGARFWESAPPAGFPRLSGQPVADAAALALFLCSTAAGEINGQVFDLPGQK